MEHLIKDGAQLMTLKWHDPTEALRRLSRTGKNIYRRTGKQEHPNDPTDNNYMCRLSRKPDILIGSQNLEALFYTKTTERCICLLFSTLKMI